jgi:hypothetical protein
MFGRRFDCGINLPPLLEALWKQEGAKMLGEVGQHYVRRLRGIIMDVRATFLGNSTGTGSPPLQVGLAFVLPKVIMI